MPAVVSPVAGTRTEPMDGYKFVRGTTATFKIVFTNEGVPTKVDTATDPVAKILKPVFLNDSTTPVPQVITTLTGSLVPGQEFEYQFSWDIPANQVPIDEYIITYEGFLGGIYYNFGDEFFAIFASPAQIGIKTPSYATVDDIRMKKFNIDDYLPNIFSNDLTSRNKLIENHIRDASLRLKEELNLHKSRAMSENYRLFTIYYTIYTILLASRGEDGSSVSDANLNFWRAEWERILAQEKRESVMQGIALGRG
jgi:hypothetical protein